VNVAFFGTSAFGADVMRALVERGRLTVSEVVSQPDRESGRGRRLTPPPVAEAARELGLHVVQPERASDAPPRAEAGSWSRSARSSASPAVGLPAGQPASLAAAPLAVRRRSSARSWPATARQESP
jgi:hypothetical protein